jgi:hypothetical protein
MSSTPSRSSTACSRASSPSMTTSAVSSTSTICYAMSPIRSLIQPWSSTTHVASTPSLVMWSRTSPPVSTANLPLHLRLSALGGGSPAPHSQDGSCLHPSRGYVVYVIGASTSAFVCSDAASPVHHIQEWWQEQQQKAQQEYFVSIHQLQRTPTNMVCAVQPMDWCRSGMADADLATISIGPPRPMSGQCYSVGAHYDAIPVV